MRIVLSLLTLVPGLSGGTETYARALCRALARGGSHDYLALLPTVAPDAGEGLPSEVVTAYRASDRIAGRLAAMARAAFVPYPIRPAFARACPDLIHYPLTIALPEIRTVPFVITLQDLQHEAMPEMFSSGELAFRRLVYRRSARRASMVITASDFSRAAIIERLGIDQKRVRRIHHGVDHERFRPAAAPRENFLLYPANRWQHKNHDVLFEAWSLIRHRRPELRLVLTGAGHEGHPVPEGVTVEGWVSAGRLAVLYQTAAALVFPSLFEGFGMPLLEAMASGCPVACSNTTALPEICGDAAVQFDPESPRSIAGEVLRLLEGPEPWVARGLQRAAHFRWEKAALEHEAVFEEAGDS